jgi:hypothetical protein
MFKPQVLLQVEKQGLGQFFWLHGPAHAAHLPHLLGHQQINDKNFHFLQWHKEFSLSFIFRIIIIYNISLSIINIIISAAQREKIRFSLREGGVSALASAGRQHVQSVNPLTKYKV